MRKNKIFLGIYILTCLVFTVSGTMFVYQLKQQSEFENYYQEMFEISEEEALSPSNTEGQLSPTLFSKRVAQMSENYADMVAWLQIADTSIDYPVMFGEDNQFYLTHLPNGEKNSLGSLFLDYRSNKDSSHLIVYGHNDMKEQMFGLLKHYTSQEYFDQHNVITFSTREKEYHCPIFSVRYIWEDDITYTLDINQEDLQQYIEQARQKSLYSIDVDCEQATHILTLSTCTRQNNQRLVVQALLLE